MKNITEITKGGPIIVFDAMCVLCSANAQFILKHDRRGHFRLASMQGEVGASLYKDHGIDPDQPDSMIIVDGDTLLRDSDAVLSIYEGLGWPWKTMALIRIVPAIARNFIYRWIARNRYELFGIRTSCWIAPPEYKKRIL